MAKTRSAKQEAVGHVVQLDIHEDLSTIVTIRKDGVWFYFTVEPPAMENEKVRRQFEEKATAARQQQIHEERMVQGETQGGPAEKSDQATAPDHGAAASQVDSVEDLRSFLQPAFESLFSDYSFPKDQSKSLSDWYSSRIDCFSLEAGPDDSELVASVREDLDGQEYLRKHLTPNLALPKYLQEMSGFSWIAPADVEVVKESHDIHLPLHPTLVKYEGKQLFLKLASAGDEHAVKRELKMLHELEKNDLYADGIRAPRLEGLVTVPSSPKSHESIMGFLLTMIPQPSTPLTKMMSDDISAKKRKGWAKDSERMVELLHRKKIIWGDAKSDNFIVDQHDKLWMIDFGGGMTVGWMDPKKYGTVKGDDEATQKIVEGMLDPVTADSQGLIFDTDEKTPGQQDAADKKRKRRPTSTEPVKTSGEASSKKTKTQAA